ncbi:oxidoreductase [Streptomyces sp. NPDC006923]|uniref:oxidoreductase n=1 Tax=Streptomyces sp. NPDC006923 TaxID=3155355 RepID=UPI0033FF2261
MTKTWFITGAGRGLGLEVTRAALANGDNVVATARKPEQVREAVSGHGEQFLAVTLDVTDSGSVGPAVQAALDRYGRIDVLVNNAGYGQLGAFEELSPEAIERQFQTNVFGAFHVTRAVLPTMRAQRSGHVITISSLTGIIGIDGSSIYCAAKFAVTGWSESLSRELAQFGVRATSVHPGMFRTDFLDPSSVSHGDVEIEDYHQFREDRRTSLDASNHNQPGNPTAFGPAVVRLAEAEEPPARWAAGSDAVDAFRQRAAELRDNADEWLELSKSTDIRSDG